MKALSILALALLSINAQAELKAPGTVLSTQCASIVAPVENTRVCYASITGREGSYLTIDKDVYAITGKTNDQGQAEIDHIGFIGARGQLEFRASMDMRLGQVSSLRGTYGDAIKIETRDGVILASKFEIVFHTMSL
jgi:hypothetical protein